MWHRRCLSFREHKRIVGKDFCRWVQCIRARSVLPLVTLLFLHFTLQDIEAKLTFHFSPSTKVQPLLLHLVPSTFKIRPRESQKKVLSLDWELKSLVRWQPERDTSKPFKIKLHMARFQVDNTLSFTLSHTHSSNCRKHQKKKDSCTLIKTIAVSLTTICKSKPGHTCFTDQGSEKRFNSSHSLHSDQVDVWFAPEAGSELHVNDKLNKISADTLQVMKKEEQLKERNTGLNSGPKTLNWVSPAARRLQTPSMKQSQKQEVGRRLEMNLWNRDQVLNVFYK